jgi:Holliday junction resolvase RusA-like endonuclease
VAIIEKDLLAIRVRTVEKLGLNFPLTAQLILDWAQSQKNHTEAISFAVPCLPPSVNHMYIAGPNGRRILSPETIRFRWEVLAAVSGRNFRPQGVLMCLIFYKSPAWITKSRRVRKMDADNRQKALFDAFKHATGIDDSLVFEYHAYKIPGESIQTLFYAVDIGNIVEFFK